MLFMVTNRKNIPTKMVVPTPTKMVVPTVRSQRAAQRAESDVMPRYQYKYFYGYRAPNTFLKTGKQGFKQALLAELNRLKNEQKINTPKAGIYLHGYNNNWNDSVDEILDLEEHLGKVCGYKPVIVGFSWPSTGYRLDYLSDREHARCSAGALTRLIGDMNDFAASNEKDCFSTTFCIAHSMGCYLLRKGLEDLSKRLGSPKGRLLFDETILLAPDISSNDINVDGKAQYIADFSRRVHVYYSKFDKALKLSSIKRFGANRLGRHGANNYDDLPGNLVVVDAKKYANAESIAGNKDRKGNQVSVHSSHRYHPTILEDVFQVISSTDRDQIKGRTPVFSGDSPNNHYRLV